MPKLENDRTIWKTVLEPEAVQEIEVPAGADFLCAREQRNDICIWFRCNPDAQKIKRTIYLVGTGHAAPHPMDTRYLGSASLQNGNFIYHVFLGKD